MSGGRVELGIGTGWYGSEHSAYGIPFPDVPERFDRFAEQLEIIDGLWRTPPGETYYFDGTHYQLSDSPALPKPAQSPRPPIILGGRGKKRSAALAARFADEYNVSFDRPPRPRASSRTLRAAAAGDGPRHSVYSAAQCAVRREGRRRGPPAAPTRSAGILRSCVRTGLGGTPGAGRRADRRVRRLGCRRMYLQVLDLADLDHVELLAAEVLGKV